MYKLKKEFREYYEAHKQEIQEAEQVFFANDSKYLKEDLTAKWKKTIDSLWYKSPLSKIQDGFHNEALLDYELADLKKDRICGTNKNKSYWVKSYMLRWLEGMPEIANDGFLMSCIGRRPAYTCLIQNAYEVK